MQDTVPMKLLGPPKDRIPKSQQHLLPRRDEHGKLLPFEHVKKAVKAPKPPTGFGAMVGAKSVLPPKTDPSA